MADPQHTPSLDSHDGRTVRLYRLGVGISALGVLAESIWGLGAHRAMEGDPERGLRWTGMLLALGVALTIANLHLYDKRVRWIMGGSGILGLWLMAFSSVWGEGPVQHLVFTGGLGFCLVTISAVALKEQFCFRIPGLKLVPLFLAASMLPAIAGHVLGQGVLLLPAGVLLVVLTVAKWRMPLGHDVGDKSRYQV